jgi:putative PIN family toxin of toxin-antitoxin system
MGQKTVLIHRVVLDTNVLVSALLFRGPVSKLVDLWKTGRIKPVVSLATFQELKKVLTYPKFALTPDEILFLLEEEVLPYFEVINVPQEVKGICRDPRDHIFLSCASAAGTDFLITGDEDLLTLKKFQRTRILTPSDFMVLLADHVEFNS